MTESEIIAFVHRLGLHGAEKEAIMAALLNFPVDCLSRGMFAKGVLKAAERPVGALEAELLQQRARYPKRIMGFQLYPHRDFYLVFYSVATTLYPDKTLAEGMRLLAESFYPIFASSLIGRTMSALIGKTPADVLSRFAEAYKIATPWCEHSITQVEPNRLLWHCTVEPCPHYTSTFAGICTGMVRTVTGITPEFETLSIEHAGDRQKFVFQISWR